MNRHTITTHLATMLLGGIIGALIILSTITNNPILAQPYQIYYESITHEAHIACLQDENCIEQGVIDDLPTRDLDEDDQYAAELAADVREGNQL